MTASRSDRSVSNGLHTVSIPNLRSQTVKHQTYWTWIAALSPPGTKLLRLPGGREGSRCGEWQGRQQTLNLQRPRGWFYGQYSRTRSTNPNAPPWRRAKRQQRLPAGRFRCCPNTSSSCSQKQLERFSPELNLAVAPIRFQRLDNMRIVWSIEKRQRQSRFGRMMNSMDPRSSGYWQE